MHNAMSEYLLVLAPLQKVCNLHGKLWHFDVQHKALSCLKARLNAPLIELAKTMPNLIITPHIAWASDSAVTTLTKKVTQNIEDFVQQLNQK